MGKAPAMKPWPKLSADLPYPRDLDTCQSCGLVTIDKAALKRWIEHDDDDRPRPIVVVLCGKCSGQMIEPHPRLYREMHEWEPMPGVMEICVGCVHRDGVRCANPRAQINGGRPPGLKIVYPEPLRAHICRSPRRHSGWTTIWQGAPRECDGREVVALLKNEVQRG